MFTVSIYYCNNQIKIEIKINGYQMKEKRAPRVRRKELIGAKRAPSDSLMTSQ